MKDCVGNEIHQGAILKVFHFIGSRNRKHFMYKLVGEIFKANDGSEYRKIYHLGEEGYYLKPINTLMDDSVVVQCPCEKHIYEDLKISKFHGT